MPEVTINLDNHDEELAVFGSRDQFLRQVRDAFGVKLVARHGEVRVEGETTRVELARQILEELKSWHRRRRVASAGDVADLIESRSRVRAARIAPIRSPRSARETRSFAPGPRAKVATWPRCATTNSSSASGRPVPGRPISPWPWRSRSCVRGRSRKIVLVRPAVEAGEHLGFLPGDLEAKINPYLRPLLDALHDLMDYDQIRRYMGNDLIEIAPLAYMRGRTLNDAVIILDEGQNATVPQMKMFLTRMGQNARIVVTGDTTQVDLPPATVSGLADAVERLKGVPGIGIARLENSDIVRHPLVQAIVTAYEEYDRRHGLGFDRTGDATADEHRFGREQPRTDDRPGSTPILTSG